MGTGSPIPDPKRAEACTAIIAGGHVVIIDAGPGAWAKLAQANVPPAQIDTVLRVQVGSTVPPRHGVGVDVGHVLLQADDQATLDAAIRFVDERLVIELAR